MGKSVPSETILQALENRGDGGRKRVQAQRCGIESRIARPVQTRGDPNYETIPIPWGAKGASGQGNRIGHRIAKSIFGTSVPAVAENPPGARTEEPPLYDLPYGGQPFRPASFHDPTAPGKRRFRRSKARDALGLVANADKELNLVLLPLESRVESISKPGLPQEGDVDGDGRSRPTNSLVGKMGIEDRGRPRW